MARILVLLGLTVVAIGVALVLQRRRPDPPSAPSYRAPTQVDRSDFNSPSSDILLAVFTSATCSSCAVALESASKVIAGQSALSLQEIEVNRDAQLHSRYKIDGVPTTLIIDAAGVVTSSFFGPTDPEQLKTALAESEDYSANDS